MHHAERDAYCRSVCPRRTSERSAIRWPVWDRLAYRQFNHAERDAYFLECDPMNPQFRPYTAADRAGCLAVFDSNVPKFFRDHERAAFESFIDAGEHPYFVLQDASRIIGCGGYGQREGSELADLCWGMVTQSEHGKRLGELLLLGRLKAIAQSNSATGVRLATSQHTVGFYLRYGFTVKSHKPNGFADGLDDVEMVLPLTAETRHAILMR